MKPARPTLHPPRQGDRVIPTGERKKISNTYQQKLLLLATPQHESQRTSFETHTQTHVMRTVLRHK